MRLSEHTGRKRPRTGRLQPVAAWNSPRRQTAHATAGTFCAIRFSY